MCSSVVQVQIKLVAQQPTQLKVKLVAYLLTANQLLNIKTWTPCTQDDAETISNGEIEKMLQCTLQTASNDAQAATVYTGCHCVTFNGKKQALSTTCITTQCTK